MVHVDSSEGKKETVEVGVIVMGLCCICLVACALVVLQLRSNNRRIYGNRRRAGHSGGVSGDRSRDSLDVGAPPSYDAGTLAISAFKKIYMSLKNNQNPGRDLNP